MAEAIFKPAGFLRTATIIKIEPNTMTATIRFSPNNALGSTDKSGVPAQLPVPYISSGGGFIGGYIGSGTQVVVAQVEGGQYIIVAFLARDPAANSTRTITNTIIPDLVEGQLTIQANLDSNINLDEDGIIIGEPDNLLDFDVKRNVLLNSFDANYSISQGSRLVDGEIKRDRMPRTNFASSLMTTDISYDDGLKSIGMDPVATTRNSNQGNAFKNPARTERRELVLEYRDDANVQSNDVEIKLYDVNSSPLQPNYQYPDRRESRADTLSLSLVDPNFLIETTKGTVVDVFGNIIDINRSIIPIGDPQTSDPTKKSVLSISKIKSTVDEQNTFKNAFEQIKRAERKSIAFHFEINARKETALSQFQYSPYGSLNVNDQSDYARARSRFFLDIDKEGQLKLNVPASSEVGNISLLTRYENYSTIAPNPATNSPTTLTFNQNYQDLFVEPFANTQVITLQDDLGNTVGPINRFSDPSNIVAPSNPQYIKHGSAYHDISQTINTLQQSGFTVPLEYQPTTNLGSVTPLSDIVTKTIIIAGPQANAGGRSASLNFDGSIEINVGANTVDRQSIWLDTQGGIVANIGRDLNTGSNVSVAANFDGDVVFQIGGNTVPAETQRFQGATSYQAGAFDIRVFNQNGELTVLRIDNEGLTVSAPGRIVYYSNGDMTFRSSGNIILDAETMIIQDRIVIKDPSQPI
jgi:hypothetical protein